MRAPSTENTACEEKCLIFVRYAFLAAYNQSLRSSALQEDTDVLTHCTEPPNMLGVADFVDYSNLAVSYEEDGIHIERKSIIRWDMQVELKKFARGTWQQTLSTVMVADMCKDMKIEYNHEPFVVKAESDVKGVNMEGRYKIEVVLQAHDTNGLPQPNAVCVETQEEGKCSFMVLFKLIKALIKSSGHNRQHAIL
uniref:Uncharacterized protein n=1 Tax=Glossina brevipalpis TaxID=37001 RepID=A0A1A9WR63_9MUSC